MVSLIYLSGSRETCAIHFKYNRSSHTEPYSEIRVIVCILGLTYPNIPLLYITYNKGIPGKPNPYISKTVSFLVQYSHISLTLFSESILPSYKFRNWAYTKSYLKYKNAESQNPIGLHVKLKWIFCISYGNRGNSPVMYINLF